MKIFADQPVNRLIVVTFVHDITTRLPDFMASSEQFLGMPGIVSPAVGGNEPGDHPQFCIYRDRSFQEMFSDFPGSFREIVAAVSVRKTR
jgi:hypothetical protein